MHELSIALSILDVAAEKAERHPGKVRAIHLKLGALSGVVKEALLGAYEMARESSALADADLVIEDVPVIVRCPHCDGPRPVVSVQDLRCRDCGEVTPEVISGRELEIVAIEVET